MCSNNISLEHKTIEDEIININYWKEIHKEISEILKNLRGIVIVTHNSIEFTEIVDLLNRTRPDHFHNILYISLIRSYDFMRLALNKKPLDKKRLFFIDCVSGYTFPEEETVDDCMYHKPPHNLEEMKKIIKFGIEKSNPDIVVIDSLSQFINFSRPTESEISDLYKFLQSIRTSSLNIIQDTFILLYDTKLGVMQNLPKFSTDLILKIEITKEEPRWRG
ncbi:MAG: hypothetical protein ACOC80_05760 [Petrotogales bacterium]